MAAPPPSVSGSLGPSRLQQRANPAAPSMTPNVAGAETVPGVAGGTGWWANAAKPQPQTDPADTVPGPTGPATGTPPNTNRPPTTRPPQPVQYGGGPSGSQPERYLPPTPAPGQRPGGQQGPGAGKPARTLGVNNANYGEYKGDGGATMIDVGGEPYILDGNRFVKKSVVDEWAARGIDLLNQPDPSQEMIDARNQNSLERSQARNRNRRESVAKDNDTTLGWNEEAASIGYRDWRAARLAASQAFKADPIGVWQRAPNGGGGDMTKQPTQDDLDRFEHWLWITNPKNQYDSVLGVQGGGGGQPPAPQPGPGGLIPLNPSAYYSYGMGGYQYPSSYYMPTGQGYGQGGGYGSGYGPGAYQSYRRNEKFADNGAPSDWDGVTPDAPPGPEVLSNSVDPRLTSQEMGGDWTPHPGGGPNATLPGGSGSAGSGSGSASGSGGSTRPPSSVIGDWTPPSPMMISAPNWTPYSPTGKTGYQSGLERGVGGDANSLRNTAGQLTPYGVGAIRQSLDYWSRIMGQGSNPQTRAALDEAITPERETINAAARSARANIQATPGRGAARETDLAELERERFSQVAGLPTRARAAAASSLASTGATATGQGISATGQAAQIGQGLLSTDLQREQFQQGLQEQSKQFGASQELSASQSNQQASIAAAQQAIQLMGLKVDENKAAEAAWEFDQNLDWSKSRFAQEFGLSERQFEEMKRQFNATNRKDLGLGIGGIVGNLLGTAIGKGKKAATGK